ncbi:MAG: class I fructose-bisphosphate aldolase [Planctomycetota bacterium]|jgi:fructose-bisphosphate aldolase class I
MNLAELNTTATALVAPGRGILAADESTPTIKKRFDAIGVTSTEETRQAYRELLFTTAGAEKHISGVILYDETIRQSAKDGTAFPKLLADKGIIPGIKVDMGAKAQAGFPGETFTQGLDGLRERLAEYKGLGARFAKWRAVYTIGDGTPTRGNMLANAQGLAAYAALCQEAGIVPIVEPEILMNGSHGIERCYEVTCEVLHQVFGALRDQRVELEGMLLKPNMVISGEDSKSPASVQDVAEATVRCFRHVVPAAVPGIVFLSGGQSDEAATVHLDAMNKLGPHPWVLSFSYGRALQHAAQVTWKGKEGNVAAAQKAFAHRARLNGAAAAGKYDASMEKELVPA